MADDQQRPDPASAPPRSTEELLRENRIMERRLRRMEADLRQLEEFQDSNSRLLSQLVRDLEEERARSRSLLLNVLPERIIQRLEAGESRIADRHETVAVLFSDFVDFTRIAAALEPQVLIDELNDLFSGFDEVCERTGVEKVKTIGDAYLAVGGLSGTGDPAATVAEAALGMRDLVANRIEGPVPWRMRIGIHTGSLIAGVVGVTRFAYDVWGDTVNVASRLETTGEPGRIHISAEVARAIEARYVVESRGLTDLKGKGLSPTYWLVGRRITR
jgi:adenylate cyclase